MDWMFSVLAFLASLLVSPGLPQEDSKDWTIATTWQKSDNGYKFIATSKSIPLKCQQSPMSYLHAPTLNQGAHYFYLDDTLVFATTAPNLTTASDMNSPGIVPCHLLISGRHLTWEVVVSAGSHAQIPFWPSVVSRPPFEIFFSHTVPTAAAGILLLLGIVCVILFWGKDTNQKILFYFFISNLLASLHFMFSNPSFFNINMTPISLHRLHDVLLWTGTIAMWMLFRELGIISLFVQRWQLAINCIAIFIIICARDLDQAQLGSTVAFVGDIVLLLILLTGSIRQITNAPSNTRVMLQRSVIAIYCTTGIMDLAKYIGVSNTPAVYSVGVIAIMVLLSLIVNLDIQKAYEERDHLRVHLETKVEEKTRDLKLAYENLQAMKADAIESAKLVALGTLSAGVAHEINNSLNYVRGSIDPLKKIVEGATLSEKNLNRANALLKLMQEGMTLTFGIIQSLKGLSSKESGHSELIKVKDNIDNVIPILGNKINGEVAIEVSISEDVEILCYRVSFSQICLNIINNALDALLSQDDQGRPKHIKIYTTHKERSTILYFEDNGPGMPEDIVRRIFEPFYTTKEQGKGTGLGLYLVRKEMDRLGGTIIARSTLGVGTQFELHFPDDKNDGDPTYSTPAKEYETI